MDESEKVIIVGGGFAGVKCAQRLRRLLPASSCSITIFNQENHLVFSPLLAEVVGAAIQPQHVAAPLRQMLKDVECRTEEVIEIYPERHSLAYRSHAGQPTEIGYDHLVLACGSSVNLAIVPGMADHSFVLKTVGDAILLQSRVMEQLEKAQVADNPDDRKHYLSFVIVGGGFSGVEVAGEINNLLRRSIKFFSKLSQSDISVRLIHRGSELRIMMRATPVIKPDITGYGKYRMSSPARIFPRTISNTPAMIVEANAISARPGLAARIPATTTAIGPVGPDCCPRVPPNHAARIPHAIAPYSPAAGPRPEAMPKAMATGKATTVVISPPMKSPAKFEKRDVSIFLD